MVKTAFAVISMVHSGNWMHANVIINAAETLRKYAVDKAPARSFKSYVT